MVSEKNISDQREDYELEKNRFPLAEAFIAGTSNDDSKTASLMQGANKAFVLSKTWNAKLNAEPMNAEPINIETKVLELETTEVTNITQLDEIIMEDQALEVSFENNVAQTEPVGSSATNEPIQFKDPFIQRSKIQKSKENTSENKVESLPSENSKMKGRMIRSIVPMEEKMAIEHFEPKRKRAKKDSTKETKENMKSVGKVKELKSDSKLVPNDFYSWLDSLHQPSSSNGAKGHSKGTNKDKSINSESFPQKLKKSQELKAEVASETLAALLASQGHKSKAIKMYEKLIRKNPEKTTIFAALIEKLKS